MKPHRDDPLGGDASLINCGFDHVLISEAYVLISEAYVLISEASSPSGSNVDFTLVAV